VDGRGAAADASSIDLGTPLSLRAAFRFPLQTRASRREIWIGALWLLVPGLGWILSMGHRIAMVRRMQRGLPAWPAWQRPGALLRDGLYTLLGMLEYFAPAIACAVASIALDIPWLLAPAVPLALLAAVAIPGYMTHYCRTEDPREIFHPVRALRRVGAAGRDYLRAWAIALCALATSLVGLLALGVGFLVTSVWFWQVAGFAFASVFSRTASRADSR
jgi:hypothetical protein